MKKLTISIIATITIVVLYLASVGITHLIEQVKLEGFHNGYDEGAQMERNRMLEYMRVKDLEEELHNLKKRMN